MDAIRRRLRDDFKGHFRGKLLLDDITRGLYATDASLFEIEPLAITMPRDEEDLCFLLRYAMDHQIPIIPRGAGTGLAGESLGSGLIVDLSVNFRSILEVGCDTVRVQPGVVCRNLNEVLAKDGRRFAPVPESTASCTLGGMLATNASGNNALIHGYTSDHVASLRVVWDNAEAETLHRPTPGGNGAPAGYGKRTEEIRQAVMNLVRVNEVLIGAMQPKTVYNRCGYRLHDILGADGLDLPRLLVGSEGTLALFSEAVLKTIPLPGGRAAVLFGFDALDSALRAAAYARPMRPSACDLLDRRLITLIRGQSPEMAQLIPASAEAVLLVEFERDSADEARQAVLQLIDQLQIQARLALLALPAFDDEAIERLWQVRGTALPALFTLGRGPRPLAFIEDIGVAPDDLSDFLNRLQTILQRYETTASFLIHAATGQIHARPFLDLDKPEDAVKLWAIAEQVHGLVIDMGGTISTQHGMGIARTPWIEKQYGRLFPVFRELKRIFDPRGILNPGKIVGPDPSRPAWPLRSAPADNSKAVAEGASNVGENHNTEETPAGSATVLLWQEGEVNAQISSCNGCGSCRTEDSSRRMCPTFRVQHEEAAAPRAKAEMLRRILSSGHDRKLLGSDEVRDVADLCINCKMCAHECPAHVNIPKLMLEAKAVHHAEHGLERTDWLLARIETLAALGSNFPLTTNTLLGNRIVRWLLDKLLGLSRHRRLPAFAPRSFLKRAKRKGWTRKSAGRRRATDGPTALQLNGTRTNQMLPKVAYFVDIFANYYDPFIAEATVAVLRHQGIPVFVPPTQKGCGMAPLAQGDVETARDTLTHNLRLLADLARDGYTIICTEPSAAVMLRHDALDLIDDPDVKLVAANTMELTSFLWRLHVGGMLRTDFRPLDVSLGHHVPCHIKALGQGVHGPALLSLIPRLQVHTIDRSCSGMAGTYGLKARNFTTSLAAGKPMLDELSRPSSLFGSTECGSCRMQMEQGSDKRTLHPVQYLALAYGLMPEIAARLRKPLRGLVTS